MELLPRFIWLALIPQLVFWVGFTILIASLTGSPALVVLRRFEKLMQRSEV